MVGEKQRTNASQNTQEPTSVGSTIVGSTVDSKYAYKILQYYAQLYSIVDSSSELRKSIDGNKFTGKLKNIPETEIIFDYKTFSHRDNQLSLNGMIQNGQMKTIYTESNLSEYYSYYSYFLNLIKEGSVILKMDMNILYYLILVIWRLILF